MNFKKIEGMRRLIMIHKIVSLGYWIALGTFLSYRINHLFIFFSLWIILIIVASIGNAFLSAISDSYSYLEFKDGK